LREIALHILDLIENSLRAGATTIAVSLEQDPPADRMVIRVEDDGPGLQMPPEQALDPFFSTKPGKKTGLGLSLFRFRLEQAGGCLTLGRSALGGLEVQGEVALGHVDRSPLGDLATTLSGVVATSPQVDLRCSLRVGDRRWNSSSRELAEAMAGDGGANPFTLAREVYRNIKEGLAALRIKE
jgi:Histidine kinase-, DNA gyrase B-, and HSP90-like ATPase